MPPSTARASAPTVVVSLLTEIHLNPPLTFLNYPHRIASSDLLPLSPTSFTSPLNLTLRRTNRESRMQNPLLPRVRRASGFVQIFLSQVPRRDTLGSTRKLTAGALVDRKLRFVNSCRWRYRISERVWRSTSKRKYAIHQTRRLSLKWSQGALIFGQCCSRVRRSWVPIRLPSKGES